MQEITYIGDYMDSNESLRETPILPERILLGPGPSMVNPIIMEAMMTPMIGYLDPDFMDIIDEVSTLLGKAYRSSGTSMALTGTGSSGMEAGLSSILEPGDTVIICAYGYFCERMVEMAQRLGANVVPLRSEWGKPFPEESLERELKHHRNVKMVSAIHGETSTGIEQPLNNIAALTEEYETLLMVDAVTTFGGTVIETDDLGIDYIYSATQKCVGAPPGLSPVSLSDRALSSIRSRTQKPFSWYLDLDLITNYWKKPRAYHHTTPVSLIMAVRKSLEMMLKEGLEARSKRHKDNANALIAGLESMGLKPVAPPEHRLAQITPVWIPEGVDDDFVRSTLLNEYNIEIGKGLGDLSGKVWRIGLMGESSKKAHVLALLNGLGDILPNTGFNVDKNTAMRSAEAIYAAVPSNI